MSLSTLFQLRRCSDQAGGQQLHPGSDSAGVGSQAFRAVIQHHQGPCVVSQDHPPLRRVQWGWVRRVGGSLRRFDETGAADRKTLPTRPTDRLVRNETRDGVSASIRASTILSRAGLLGLRSVNRFMGRENCELP